MGYARFFGAGLAAVALLAGSQAAAQSDVQSAEKIRRLDIMLMVTSLRCRFTSDDFQADYRAFSARHLSTLNAAGTRLTQNLSARYGTQGARRQLDRISTSMANSYGLGHPTMDCAELKRAARALANDTPSTGLAAAADVLLAGRPGDSSPLLAQR